MIKKNLNLKLNMNRFRILKLLFIFVSVSLYLSGSTLLLLSTSAQNKSIYKVGERLTYNISFEKFNDAAYAEIYVVSKGKLEGKDAIELSAKIKTVDLVSAAFYLFDETRSTFVSEQTGLPFYVRTATKTSGFPKEKISNFLNSPTTNYDLLSMIYKVRETGGAGSFSVSENDEVYNFDFAATGGEVVKTVESEYETTLSTVQSSYLTEHGITNFRVNFTNDERKIPVQIRFKTEKGEFKAVIASIQMLKPTPTPEDSPSITPTPTPIPTRTPVPTPKPYVDNQPLSPDLPFVLGEALEFRVTNNGQSFGKVILLAKERKKFRNLDSLLLTAKVSEVGQGNSILNLQDSIEAQVDANTLLPSQVQIKLIGGLSIFNQTTIFNQDRGIVRFNGAKSVSVPNGTHSILSLAYAVRNFNLRPSLDPKNPINDTRVALFLGSRPYVLTLRPSNTTLESQDGKKVPAQLISIRTGDRNIDSLNLRLWLSVNRKRLPLRFAFGSYQADLIQTKIISPTKPQ